MALNTMIATDSNLKRVFQQLHDAAIDALAAPMPRPFALGAAMGFVTTTMVLTRELFASGRLKAATENALRQVVDDAVSTGKLVVTQPDANAAADRAATDYRHLRNCFGHGNWTYDENAVGKASMRMTLEDHHARTGKKTWGATIDLPDLVNLAEKLMVETFNRMP